MLHDCDALSINKLKKAINEKLKLYYEWKYWRISALHHNSSPISFSTCFSHPNSFTSLTSPSISSLLFPYYSSSTSFLITTTATSLITQCPSSLSLQSGGGEDSRTWLIWSKWRDLLFPWQYSCWRVPANWHHWKIHKGRPRCCSHCWTPSCFFYDTLPALLFNFP